MTLTISREALEAIHRHGELTYPEEGAGFLVGTNGRVDRIHALENAREDRARQDRYLITPADYIHAEKLADELGLELIGVFHSHPDHPNHPSEYDREWAQPSFIYMITSVDHGMAVESRAWRLAEDRLTFDELVIQIVKGNG